MLLKWIPNIFQERSVILSSIGDDTKEKPVDKIKPVNCYNEFLKLFLNWYCKSLLADET